MSLRQRWREWRLWRSWRRRYDYREWALELRRQLVAYGVRNEALVELNAKQDKINRLQSWIRNNSGVVASIQTNYVPKGLHHSDMRPERLINTAQHYFTEFSRQFEDRAAEYERTGKYDPVRTAERVSTWEQAPEDPDNG